MIIKSTNKIDAKKELSNLVTDILSDKGQNELTVLLLTPTPNEKERELIDRYIDKTKDVASLYHLLTPCNIDNYIRAGEMEKIDSIRTELYKHKLKYLVIDIELNMENIRRLCAHLIPTDAEIELINQYIGKIDEIGGIYDFLVKNKHIQVSRYNSIKIKRLEDLKSRLIGYRQEYKRNIYNQEANQNVQTFNLG